MSKKQTNNDAFNDCYLKELLDAVFENQELYNRKHTCFGNRKRTKKVWSNVAKNLKGNFKGQACEKKWNQIRGKFLAFYRTVTMVNGKKHYLHDNMIRFLPFISDESESMNNSDDDLHENRGDSLAKVPDRTASKEIRLANIPPRSKEIIQFIEIVYRYPELYSKSHPMFYDHQHVNHIWTLVASQVNKDGKQCSHWWARIFGLFDSFYHQVTLRTGLKHALHKEMCLFLPSSAKQGNYTPHNEPRSHLRFSDNEDMKNENPPDEQEDVQDRHRNIEHLNNEETSTSFLRPDNFQITLTQSSSVPNDCQIMEQPLDVLAANKENTELNNRQNHQDETQPITSCLLSANFKIKQEKQHSITKRTRDVEIIDLVAIKREKFVNDIETINIDDDDNVQHLDMESISQVGSSVRTSGRDEQKEHMSKEAREELIESFFKAVSVSVKNLTPVRQNQAKVRIFEIISNLELEQLQDRS